MNANHSHCMIRRALPVAAALFFALAAAAQTRMYDRSLRDYPWLDGTNAAALRSTATPDISYVVLYAGASRGGFHRSWESD